MGVVETTGAMKITVKRVATASTAAALWRPAVVLPSQVEHTNWRRRSPEMQLVAAILEDALLSIRRRAGARRGRQRREFIDAWNWLWNERRDWPFAFRNVCDLLALDASAVRRCVQRALVTRGAEQLRRCQQRTSVATAVQRG